jgi:hypothetical protein
MMPVIRNAPRGGIEMFKIQDKSLFSIVVAIAFQSAFYLEMH